MLINYKDMLQRINGFSTPWVGLQWTAPASEKDAVRKFLAFLEDRRALFNPIPAEIEDHVISSINMIRSQCAETAGVFSNKAVGAAQVRAIGAACRRILDEPYPAFDDILSQRRDPNFSRSDERDYRFKKGTSPEAFFTALGEFRAFVGVQIAILSVAYKVDIHGDLARILPPSMEDFE